MALRGLEILGVTRRDQRQQGEAGASSRPGAPGSGVARGWCGCSSPPPGAPAWSRRQAPQHSLPASAAPRTRQSPLDKLDEQGFTSKLFYYLGMSFS